MKCFHFKVLIYCDSNDNHDLYYSSKWKRRDGSYELILTNHERLLNQVEMQFITIVRWALPMPP